jgi:DNA-binding FadR family transcriptional regulator
MAENVDNAEAFVLLNWQLHTRIAAISPNAVLRNTYTGLYEFVNQVSLVNPQPRDTQYMTQRLMVHSELVAAIVAGNVIDAQHAAALHRHPG